MTDIQLEVGLRKAAEWISDQLRVNPAANRSVLIDQASQRFALSPLQAEFLFRQFLQGRNETPR
jgi:hypothetical protein